MLVQDCNLSSDACQGFVFGIKGIKIRALTAMGNIFLVSNSCFHDNQPTAATWWNTFINGAKIQSEKSPIPLDLFDSYISCLWAFSRMLNEIKIKLVSSINQNITTSTAQWLCSGLNDPNVMEKTKVKMTGALVYIAMNTSDVETNKAIGTFFVEYLQQSGKTLEGAEIAREIIEGIIDIYSDKLFHYDGPVFVNLGFLGALKAVVPHLHSKFKKNNILEPDVKEHCIETLATFREFLDYKQSES